MEYSRILMVEMIDINLYYRDNAFFAIVYRIFWLAYCCLLHLQFRSIVSNQVWNCKEVLPNLPVTLIVLIFPWRTGKINSLLKIASCVSGHIMLHFWSNLLIPQNLWIFSLQDYKCRGTNNHFKIWKSIKLIGCKQLLLRCSVLVLVACKAGSVSKFKKITKLLLFFILH